MARYAKIQTETTKTKRPYKSFLNLSNLIKKFAKKAGQPAQNGISWLKACFYYWFDLRFPVQPIEKSRKFPDKTQKKRFFLKKRGSL